MLLLVIVLCINKPRPHYHLVEVSVRHVRLCVLGVLLNQVGSMLKTPRFPVWLCCINSSHSVVFSTNRLLLSDWRTERLFHLHFYNGQRSQTSTARLTVGEDRLPPTQTQLLRSLPSHPLSVCLSADTRSHHWGASSAHTDPERRSPSLDMTIRTKWDGAAIDWNNTPPFY